MEVVFGCFVLFLFLLLFGGGGGGASLFCFAFLLFIRLFCFVLCFFKSSDFKFLGVRGQNSSAGSVLGSLS